MGEGPSRILVFYAWLLCKLKKERRGALFSLNTKSLFLFKVPAGSKSDITVPGYQGTVSFPNSNNHTGPSGNVLFLVVRTFKKLVLCYNYFMKLNASSQIWVGGPSYWNISNSSPNSKFTVRGGGSYVLESEKRVPKLRWRGPLIWGITVLLKVIIHWREYNIIKHINSNKWTWMLRCVLAGFIDLTIVCLQVCWV